MILSRWRVLALVALASVALAPAQAKTKPHAHHAQPAAVAKPFPVYIDRGSERNPGGDNAYFTDTKQPNYIVGPAWFQRWN